MNTSHLSDKISELWPRLSDEHIGLICKRVAKLDLDPEQVTAALEAEWERPANKVPPHQRIIGALRLAVPKPFREVTTQSDNPDHRFFKSMRLAGKWPDELTNEQVLREMLVIIREKARRMKGVTVTDIRVAETDFRRFTTLNGFEIDAALCEIFGEDGEAYLNGRESIRRKAIERRATERDIVKSLPKTGRHGRRVEMQEIVVDEARAAVQEDGEWATI